MVVVNLLLAILPAILIGWFIYAKDINKEPKSLLVKLFVGGILSCLVTFGITLGIEAIIPGLVPDTNNLSSNLALLFVQVFIGVALVEEFSKWLFTYIFGYRSREFDEIYDAIVYCTFVALGFATLENILYVFLDEQQLVTALLRAITAVPGHVCDAIVMGYFLGIAKKCEVNGDISSKRKYLACSILMPMVTHGIYDYLIFTEIGILIIIWVVFVILMYIYAISKVNKISKSGERLIPYKQCPTCGNYTDGNFCMICGTQVNNQVIPSNQVLTPVTSQGIYQQTTVLYQQPTYYQPPNNVCSKCGTISDTAFCPECGNKIK